MAAYKIEGLEECLKAFDFVPENALKLTKKACAAGGRAVKRDLSKKVPNRWSSLVRSSVRSKGGRTMVDVGLVNREEVNGHQPTNGDPVFDWYKAYWSNYGTLQNRDPSHAFKVPIKRKSRDSKGGIAPKRFFESARIGADELFFKEFMKYYNNHFDDILR